MTRFEPTHRMWPLWRPLSPNWVRSCSWIACALLVSGFAIAEPSVPPEFIQSKPLVPRTGPLGNALFEAMPPGRTGIDFVHRWQPPHKYIWERDSQMAGGGVCTGDYDDDGLADVYLTRPHGGGRLYRNLGQFKFEDVTDQAGLAEPDVWGQGVTFVDIDNDGDLDLFVCCHDCPNRLYINQGDGTFRDEAKLFGLDFVGPSVMMAFADYDCDGDVDGFLLTNQRPQTKYQIRPSYLDFDFRSGQWVVPDVLAEQSTVIRPPDRRPVIVGAGRIDRLYRNNGSAGGGFTDVTVESGIAGAYHGLGVTWLDYNNDSFPDLYVANDYWGPDQLYRNNGDGTFSDVANASLPHTPWFSMGTDMADINNDGRFDLMASDMSGTNHFKQKVGMGDMSENGWFLESAEPRQYMRNAVYLNTGTERFMEVAYLAGLADSDWTWSIKFADLDNDGWVDVFITNGMTRDWANSDLDNEVKKLGGMETLEGRKFWTEQPKKSDHNLALRNLGDLRFESVGALWGLDHFGVSYGAALGDLDNDGDLDLVVNNFQEMASVYQNQSSEGHGVLIRLRGTASNRQGIGAALRAETAEGVHARYLTLARGYLSANEPRVHFGLGHHETIDRLSVRWPSGRVQRFENLPVDRLYTITEPDGTLERKPKTENPTSRPMFVASQALHWADHIERPYRDYDRQPLLPQKLSQYGPGLAWGDVDGDGDLDVYLGGAAGQAGVLFINRGAGAYDPDLQAVFDADREAEDMAPLLFDVDADDDLDLYVASGGVESEPGDVMLRDRLYLNDGTGSFRRSPGSALPDARDSSSAVTAADFDQDGDLDLFVGGRFVPGQYPVVPESRLLRNDWSIDERFTDVTDEVCPGLRQSGLVTGAVWSDADDDGWLDLLVTHEWGPVKLYRNVRGRLQDQTVDAGLDTLRGWWNGIAAADVDHDGDMDYAVANAGLNTKYHASPEHPALLYYGDFEGHGEMRLIEAEFESETLFPVRGKSCSTNAIPSLAEKYLTFKDFAISSLADIYTPRCLNESLRLEANTLASGILVNDGSGRFRFERLPRLVQAAPGFGVVFADANGDGHSDLYMVQNFFPAQPETGRMDGGVSFLLTGDGTGSFQPVWPDRSGLLVPENARGLTAVDLNRDGWVDFAIGVNDGPARAFVNRGQGGGRMLNVELRGTPGNGQAVGARVTLDVTDGPRQVAEVHAGSSYLSQSTSTLNFGLGQNSQVERLRIRWPDGEMTDVKGPIQQGHVQIGYEGIHESGRRRASGRELETAVMVRTHERIGQQLEGIGRHGRATAHYRRALEMEPGNAEIMTALCRAMLHLDRFEEAAGYAEAALQVNPDQAEVHFHLGVARQVFNEIDAAEDSYREVIRLHPDHAEARQNLGYLLMLKGQFEEADRHLARALDLEPGYVEAQANMALVALSKKKPEQAILHFQRVLAVRPDDVTYNHMLGKALRETGNLDEAISRYRIALSIDPASFEAHQKLAMALESKGLLDEAIEHYHEALKISPGSPIAQTNMGGVLQSRGEFDKAIPHFREALANDPNLVEARVNLGNVLRQQGRLEEALTQLRAALSLQPEMAAAHSSLGDAQQARGRFKEAIAAYRRALKLDPDSAAVHRNLGIALGTQNQLDEAIEHFRKVLELQPDSTEARVDLGLALRIQGKHDQAIQIFIDTLEIDPGHAAARRQLELSRTLRRQDNRAR